MLRGQRPNMPENVPSSIPQPPPKDPKLHPWQHQLLARGRFSGQKGQLSGCVGPIEAGYESIALVAGLEDGESPRPRMIGSSERGSDGQIYTGTGVSRASWFFLSRIGTVKSNMSKWACDSSCGRMNAAHVPVKAT